MEVLRTMSMLQFFFSTVHPWRNVLTFAGSRSPGVGMAVGSSKCPKRTSQDHFRPTKMNKVWKKKWKMRMSFIFLWVEGRSNRHQASGHPGVRTPTRRRTGWAIVLGGLKGSLDMVRLLGFGRLHMDFSCFLSMSTLPWVMNCPNLNCHTCLPFTSQPSFLLMIHLILNTPSL